MITVFGSINLDLIASVDQLPRPGETISGKTFTSAPGGKGANQALAASRAGAQTAMVGAIGNDGNASLALSLLRAANVDLTQLARSKTATGTAMIWVAADGENMIVVTPGANACVSAKQFNTIPDYLLLQGEVPLAEIEAALDLAIARGATSLLNTAPWHQQMTGFLHKADYIIANETEFAEAVGQRSVSNMPDVMREFACKNDVTIIVTLGADGVMADDGKQLYQVAAPKITAVDTVGAGDTFCGYLAAALDGGQTLGQALELATKAGALACLKPGAQPAIPNRVEVDSFEG